MAIVDLSTGKIFGCVEGSKTWFHEQGHLVFNNTEWGARISYYQQFFMMIAVFFIALGVAINNQFVIIFAFINALGMVTSYIYEEVWCWVYGLREWKSKKIM
jgi:hypothetical protein